MPKFTIEFDTETQEMIFAQDGVPIEDVDEFSISQYRRYNYCDKDSEKSAPSYCRYITATRRLGENETITLNMSFDDKGSTHFSETQNVMARKLGKTFEMNVTAMKLAKGVVQYHDVKPSKVYDVFKDIQDQKDAQNKIDEQAKQ